MKLKIGIIGWGYVGQAVDASYNLNAAHVYDPKYPEHYKRSDITVMHSVCDAIFVCVPTPQNERGECDTTALDQTLTQLQGTKALVICKSTAPPQYYEEWERRANFKLAHVPEFLTQARAKHDYVNPHKIVIGCKPELRDEVADVLISSLINFERVNIEYCSIGEASFFKYMANSMLAIKVVVNNEFADLAERMGMSWDRISNIARTDIRLGNSHWRVPGDNGEPGYGGACFPKDTESLLNIANQNQGRLAVLAAAMTRNHELRKTDGT